MSEPFLTRAVLSAESDTLVEMRRAGFLIVTIVMCAQSCATPDDDLGSGGSGGVSAGSGKGGTVAKGGTGGTPATGGNSGTTTSGGSSGSGGGAGIGGTGSGGTGGNNFGGSAGTGGGLGGAGGVAGSGGVGGSSGNGFGGCITQQELDDHAEEQPFRLGWCTNPFAFFGCVNCSELPTQPGDNTCSPYCVCAPVPPICGTESDASADASGNASEDAGATD